MQHAFTIRYAARMPALRSKIDLCLPVTPEEAKIGVPMREYVAIWDTGATNSVITKKVVDELGLKPISVSEMHHAGGMSFANVYLLNIRLPNGLMVGHVRVTEAQLIDGTNIPDGEKMQVLIGMDIIGNGDLAITNLAATTMSFRIPSVEEIDFVPQAKEHN